MKSDFFSVQKPDVAKRLFEQHLKTFFPTATRLETIRIEAEHKYIHNLNLTFDLTLTDRRGRRFQKKVFGKTKAHGSTEPAFRFLSFLWSHGFQSPPLITNRPLGYLRSVNLHLYEAMDGPLLKDIFKAASFEDLKSACEKTGRWLKKFHGLPPNRSGLPTRKPETEFFGALIYPIKQALEKEKKQELRALLDAAFELKKLQRRLPKTNPAPTHGDFGPHNIVVLKKSLGVIDFDSTSLYDPSIDVASFVNQIEFGEPNAGSYGRSLFEVQALSHAFRQAYERGNPFALDPDWDTRVTFHRLYYLYKIGAHIARWLPVSSLEKKRRIVFLLQEANRLKQKLLARLYPSS